MSDPELHEEPKEAVTEADRAAQSFRDSSTVGDFISFLFGVIFYT